MEMILAVVAFVALFTAWVVVPTLIKRRHALKATGESKEPSSPEPV